MAILRVWSDGTVSGALLLDVDAVVGGKALTRC
jgi:hypothetical protein